MAEHTAAQKRFIVLRLAAFDTPRVICDAFRMRFPDTACTEDDVNACHPRVALLPPGLADEFYTERRRLLGPDADLAEVAPFAEQKARLIALSQQAEWYAGNNQPAEARAVMRQIAEEQGAIGKGAVPKAPADPGQPITAIVRTVIDPGHPDATGVPAPAEPESV